MVADPALKAALPFIILLAWAAVTCFRTPLRFMSVAIPASLHLAAVAVLSATVYRGGAIRFVSGAQWLPAGVTVRIDGLACVLAIVTALVMSACAAYSLGYFQLHRRRRSKNLARERFFWPLLAVIWCALMVLWVSGDLLTAYIALELLGLCAAAMMLLPDRTEAVSAGMRYLFFMLLGSLTYLLGAGMCYAVYGQIDFAGIAQAVQPSALHWMAAAFMSAGLMLKAAVFPLHGWLPAAHAHAWSPVSAIHAALVVKGSFFVLVQIWVSMAPEAAAAAQLVGFAGAAAIFWGGLMALRMQKIKEIVAYSTIAQLGYLLLVVPLVAGPEADAAAMAWQGAWLHFISHALAKAAMFLSVGNLMLAMGRADLEGLAGAEGCLPLSLLVFGLAAVTIIGLPVSGGFTAKWLLLHSAILSGQWHWVVVLSGGTLLGAAYIFRVFNYALAAGTDVDCHVPLPVGKEAAAFFLAMAAVLLGVFAGWPLMLIGSGGGAPWP